MTGKEISQRIYLALLHYPIRNKSGEIITTSITNYDIHDIARIGRTYAINEYFLVNPLESQFILAERILDYWAGPKGISFLPDRTKALQIVKIVKTLEEVIGHIREKTGNTPVIVSTDARENGQRITYDQFKNILKNGSHSYLILFGTGFGLSQEILDQSDYILDPIRGIDGFNHLPVRAAVAIILDRILGERKEKSLETEIEKNQTMKLPEENYASSY